MNRYPLSFIPDNSSRSVSITAGGQQLPAILVRHDDVLYCYHNSCPHTGVNLEWVPDQFLDESGELIQCATHGALFRITDGKCIAGPCLGQGLQPLKVERKGDFLEILTASP